MSNVIISSPVSDVISQVLATDATIKQHYDAYRNMYGPA